MLLLMSEAQNEVLRSANMAGNYFRILLAAKREIFAQRHRRQEWGFHKETKGSNLKVNF